MHSLTIVIPVFNEEAVLPELFGRLKRVLDGESRVLTSVLFVDDGSRDTSVSLIIDQNTGDSRFKLIELSRNFGFQNALAAGMASSAQADAIITMDADLQDPPEVIVDLITAWLAGAEVVRAVRRSREETGLRRLAFDIFHAVFSRLSDHPIEPHSGTFGLLTRPALTAFNQLQERHRFFPGMRSWVGFKRVDVPYDRKQRAAGMPQQTMRKLVRYALDGVFSFSHLPLRMLTYLGLLIAGIGFGVSLFFIIRRLLGIEVAFTGFTTLVTLMLFLGGIQLVGIGVLGEYLGRIYDEVKQRPNFIIRNRVGFEK